MELECAVQKYAWGVRGPTSSVAQLAQASQPNLELPENQPFAELWMGTHPSGPSVIKNTGELLAEYISKNVEVLGTAVVERFGKQLPFLFKVLSVGQALSIQAHPNKSHAEELHRERPDVYKDPNHKPEMTIALTPFQALCGFRPPDQITSHLTEFEELRGLVGEEAARGFEAEPSEEQLKKCFTALMTAPRQAVTDALAALHARFSSTECGAGQLGELFLRLYTTYPGDVGCCSIFLLNYLTLQPGEAMFLGPNVIHAYLLGDCIECMACSDNVVRAGLTPKYQDVDTLVAMLDYSMLPAHTRKFEGFKMDSVTTMYNPPVPDFAVDMIEVPAGVEQYTLRAVESASIMLVVEGSAEGVALSPTTQGQGPQPSTLRRGTVLFLACGQSLSLRPAPASRLLAFRALCVL